MSGCSDSAHRLRPLELSSFDGGVQSRSASFGELMVGPALEGSRHSGLATHEGSGVGSLRVQQSAGPYLAQKELKRPRVRTAHSRSRRNTAPPQDELQWGRIARGAIVP